MSLKFLAGFLILFAVAFGTVEEKNRAVRLAYEAEGMRRERREIEERLRTIRFGIAAETSYARIEARVAALGLALADPARADPQGAGAPGPVFHAVGGPPW